MTIDVGGDQPQRTLALTGATGYLGRAVAIRFRDAGWNVIAFSRRPPLIAGVSYVPWSLGADIPLGDAAPDVVIHLASATMSGRPGLTPVLSDLKGLRKLLRQCRSISPRPPRFIFVSSQSSRFDAANLYGRVKFAQEKMLHGDNEIAVRPGLVYGGEDRGVFGTLLKMLSPLPIWPALQTGAVHQPIHLADFTEALFRCAGAERPLRLYFLGQAQPLDFPDLLRAIARQYRRRSVVVTLPRLFTWIARGFVPLEFVSGTSFGERLNGLLNQRAMDCGPSLATLGFQLRPFGRYRPTSRRTCLLQALTLLAYVAGSRPRTALIEVAAIKRLTRLLEDEKTQQYYLPKLVLRFPWLLRCMEPLPDSASMLSRMIAVATYVFDMSSQGARRLRLQKERGRVAAALALGYTLVVETIIFPVRIALGTVFRDRHSQRARFDRHSP